MSTEHSTRSTLERLDEYLDLIDSERDSRPAEALLADEVRYLRRRIHAAHGVIGTLWPEGSDPAHPKWGNEETSEIFAALADWNSR